MWNTDPFSGALRADCQECGARALAQCVARHQSREAGEVTPEYRTALEGVFGPALWEAGIQRVKEWAGRIALERARAGQR